MGIFQLPGIGLIKHDIYMDIPVARVSEGRDGKTILLAQFGQVTDQFSHPASGDNNIFIDFVRPQFIE